MVSHQLHEGATKCGDKTYMAAEPQLMSEESLEKCASDPNCRNAEECLRMLEKRRPSKGLDALRKELAETERIRRQAVRTELQENPFDPRQEVSADAHHVANQIVMHLWIIFVVLPGIWLLLYEVAK